MFPEIADLYQTLLADLGHQMSPGRLLDVGCAMGHFMVCARDQGWDVHGVECSPYAVEFGRARWNLSMQAACDLRDAHLPDNHFDACILVEVIEHLPHPAETLSEIFRVLKPGGMIYLTTPNFASYKSLLLREQWDVIIPAGHLYYFTAHSLRQMLMARGFDQVWDLTDPASFEQELEWARARKQLSAEELAFIQEHAQAEDEAKVTNGRAEGLRMVAFKAPRPGHQFAASLRNPAPMPQLERRLVTVGGASAESQKVYLIHEGRKHWVTTDQWLKRHGYSLESTIQVASNVLDRYYPGQPLA